jgi:hypothetical protein
MDALITTLEFGHAAVDNVMLLRPEDMAHLASWQDCVLGHLELSEHCQHAHTHALHHLLLQPGLNCALAGGKASSNSKGATCPHPHFRPASRPAVISPLSTRCN